MAPNTAMAGREDRAAGFSVERMAYAGILALALFVRLFALGNAPLSPLEAANAWPAWLQATGQTPVGAATITPGSASPLFYSGQLLLFWVAGGSDLWARFLPVVAGVAMVGLAWLLRERLGRSAALALALLMAVDPWLVYFGRLGDGTIFGLFLGLLALIALDKARGAGARGWMWLQVLAVSSGLLVSSGPVGWSMLVVLLLNGALGGLPHGPWRDPEADTDRNLFELVALAGGALLLGATTWLGNPAGLAMVGTSLGWWLAQLVSGGQDGYPLTWAGIHWVTDQLLVLVFGAVGAVRLLRGRHHGAHPGRPRTGG
ncbi:MAG: glycosyltransferase family 39 protein, partial [Caldilineaceae bacterium]|nr:glycosyltransferase family 39 protein [Caldilineaceae bacterium]